MTTTNASQTVRTAAAGRNRRIARGCRIGWSTVPAPGRPDHPFGWLRLRRV